MSTGFLYVNKIWVQQRTQLQIIAALEVFLPNPEPECICLCGFSQHLLYFEKSDFTHFSSFCFCLFCFENWGIYAYVLTSKPLKRFGSSSYIEQNSCHKLEMS